MRAEFSVFVIDRAVGEAQSLVESIRAAGYDDAQFFPTLDSALKVARLNPPHMVLFDFERNPDVAESFLIDLQATSPEIVVILMATGSQALASLQLVSRGLAYDTILRPIHSTLEVIQKLDRGAERMFFQFESEQIKEQLTLTGISLESIQESGVPVAHSAISTLAKSEQGVARLNDCLARMSTTRELDQAIQFFMESVSRHLGDTPILYFKYIPSHMSLVVAQALMLPLEKIRGVGIDLKKEDAARIPDLLNHPSKMEPLHTLVSQVFRHQNFSAFPHRVDGETVGLFVVLGNTPNVVLGNTPNVVLGNTPTAGLGNTPAVDDGAGLISDPVIFGLHQIFDLTYKRNLTLKEKHALDILDPQTGLINRRHLSQKIDEEISRSRRIFLPLSILTIDIDNFKRLNDRVGFRQADSVLKMVAMIIRKTARVSDIVARTGSNELVLLLPHTGHKGAAIKAERVRRMIEATRFPILGQAPSDPLTISVGVSEYPSFCNDAEGLVRSADEALAQVKRAGGNKVCLSTAVPGFQMDFRPLEVPVATGGSRNGDIS